MNNEEFEAQQLTDRNKNLSMANMARVLVEDLRKDIIDCYLEGDGPTIKWFDVLHSAITVYNNYAAMYNCSLEGYNEDDLLEILPYDLGITLA